jgi:hypothetical protein
MRYDFEVADQKTRDALLRLRRVNEVGAQRELGVARAHLSDAEKARHKAEARAQAAADKLDAAVHEPPPATAGRLAARDRFLGQLRANALESAEKARAAVAAAERADARLREAQSALEAALRAREAAESQEAALAAEGQRKRARREEAANQDRFAGLLAREAASSKKRRRRK